MRGILVIIFVMFSSMAYADLPIPSYDNCHFYLDLEKERACFVQNEDSSPYLVFFGYKYCGQFHLKAEHWGDNLKNWTFRTAYCLQTELAHHHAGIDSCSALESFAYDSHTRCYRKNGFCDLGVADRVRVFSVMMSLDVLLQPVKSFTELLRLANPCSTEIPEHQSQVYQLLMQLRPKMNPTEAQKAARIFDLDPVPAGYYETILRALERCPSFKFQDIRLITGEK